MRLTIMCVGFPVYMSLLVSGGVAMLARGTSQAGLQGIRLERPLELWVSGAPGGANRRFSEREVRSARQTATHQDSRVEKSHESAMHSIVVKFDYDFTQLRACTEKLKDKCISKFNIYDISGVKPYRLFSVPVPADVKGPVKGITAASPRMLFAVGKHRIGVTAELGDGKESSPRDCNTIIEIKDPDAQSTPASR